MKLKELLKGLNILSATADLEAEISGVSYDSRSTQPGQAFVAISGTAADGHKYVPMAAEKGAACAVCEHPVEGLPYVVVENTRRALAVMGANWFDHPACEMTMVGITGTKGKTTTSYLLKSILEAPEDKLTEIGCLWNAGLCCAALNKPQCFSKIYLRLQMLLAEDFPHRDDLTITIDILKGAKGHKRNAVLLNAGASLYINGKAETFKDGIALAAEIIDSGKALETLNKFIEVSNRPEEA